MLIVKSHFVTLAILYCKSVFAARTIKNAFARNGQFSHIIIAYDYNTGSILYNPLFLHRIAPHKIIKLPVYTCKVLILHSQLLSIAVCLSTVYPILALLFCVIEGDA